MAKVIIFSGAGISAESGIRTFRESDGLWEEYSIDAVCSAGCMERNKEETVAFYDARRLDLIDKQPNKAHRVIKELQEKYPTQIRIITQNVDNLFEKAGCVSVLHLHGYLTQVRCMECGYVKDIGYKKLQEAGELCHVCGGEFRPDIVFFGEAALRYAELDAELKDCEMVVVIGTSGYVVGVNSLAAYRKAILNNLEPSDAIEEQFFEKVLYKKATEAIDAIAQDVEEFLENRV